MIQALGRLRRGFTLVEVLVALALAGVVVLLAHALFTAATQAAQAIREARTALDRDANARRWLGAAFLSLEVGQQPHDDFAGRPQQVTFTARLQTSGGWFAPRRVTLREAGGRFEAALDDTATLTLRESVAAVAFDYLLVPGATARWAREWLSPVSAPLAVRVRVAHGAPVIVDTLLLLIKGRG